MKLKKMLASILCTAMVLSTMNFSVSAAEDVWDGSIDASWYDALDPKTEYTIDSAAELAGLAQLVNSGTDFDEVTFTLTTDVDLAGINWTPIGLTGSHANKYTFRGYFDGNDKTISNLSIKDTTADADNLGLFGHIHGNGMNDTVTPSVKNLTLKDVNIESTDRKSRVGGLAGNPYTCSIQNVTVSGTISGGKWTGGISGNGYTYFEDCTFEGTVTSPLQAGGIAGAGDVRVYSCNVYADVSSGATVGGIVGNGQEGTSIVNCYVEGTIKSDSNWYYSIGGIAGWAGHGYAGSIIKNNYFNGEVYLEDEKINIPLIGSINTNNEGIKTEVSGNSWNTEKYPADLNVTVVGCDEFEDNTFDISVYEEKAKETLTRNNNLIMLESDLQYVDTFDMNDVIIMSGSTVTTEEVKDAIVNNSEAVIGETPYEKLADAIAALKANDTLTIFEGEYDIPLTVKADNVTVIGVGNVILKGESVIKASGFSITGITFENADGKVINLNGNGTFKDCELYGKNCVRYAYANGGAVIFDNCKIVGTVYGIHFDSGNGSVIIKDSEISGFNAFGSALTELNIENTKFIKDEVSGYNNINFWGNTVLTDCEFSPDMLMSTPNPDKKVEVNDCTVTDGTNVGDLFVLYDDEQPQKEGTVVVDDVVINKDIQVGDYHYDFLADAVLKAAETGDVIDLKGNTIDLPEVNGLKITTSVEIKNGTIDITDGVWNGNSIIEVYGGTEGNPVVLTMTDVDVIGDNYSSAFGIIYAYNHGKVVLNNCDFTLSNEQYSAGGVLKGNGISVSAFDVTGGVFNLENPNRIIANATVNLNGVDIDAKVTDETLVPGTMNNHAFRNVVGTITDSNIVADGFETGIKNDNGVDLNIDGTSSVTLKNSVDKDLILKNNTKVIVADTALLYAENVQIEEDSVDGDVVDEYTTAPVITPNAQAFRGKSDTITITCEEEGAKIYYTTDGTNPTLASTLYTAGFSVSQTCEVKAIALVDGKMTSEITTASFVEKTTSSSNGSTGSSSPSTPSVVYYTVKFVTNSDTTINDVKVKENSVIAAPATFEKEGYIFDGWYKDADFSEAYDFDAKVTKNFTLYAKWTEEKTEDDKTEEDNKEEDKTDVTNPEENTPSDETDMNFTDVSEDFWGYEGIKYCYDSGIMNGVKEETFEPNRDASRAMLITMLYRLAGEPEITTDGTEWYSKAQAWAKDNDISDGTNMDASITREQLVTILYRYVSKKTEVSATADLSIFADSDEISDYAIEAMKWAVENGIITGVGNGNLAPKQTATRAQIATIFARAKDIL